VELGKEKGLKENLRISKVETSKRTSKIVANGGLLCGGVGKGWGRAVREE